jgi:hypothetical protein
MPPASNNVQTKLYKKGIEETIMDELGETSNRARLTTYDKCQNQVQLRLF